MTVKIVDNFINFYKTYLSGTIKGTGTNKTMDCPFCGKKDHFSFDVISGKARCLVCDVSCNNYSFLTMFHAQKLSETDSSWYEDLELERGISARMFEKAKWAWDDNRERWLVPYPNPESDNLLNLGYFTITGDNAYKIFKAPNTKGMHPLHLYMPFDFISSTEASIFEGEWDTLAGAQTMPLQTCIGAPSALIFPEPSLKFIKDFNQFRLYYDNDESGQKGTVKAANILLKITDKIDYINWKAFIKAKPKMDIRDLLVDHPDSIEHLMTYQLIPASKLSGVSKGRSNEPEELSPGYLHSISEIKVVTSLDDYFRKYQKYMHLNQCNRDAIVLGLAIATSQYIPGEPIWGFFVGSASSGKTTFIESFGGTNEYFDYASKITATNLVSGWNSGGDSSFLPALVGKCFFIKDFTVVLGEPADVQKKLFNLLRDVYDGSIKIRFGNAIERNYHNLNFNMLAGVTYAIQKHNDSSMGERFIRIDYSGADDDNQMKAVVDVAILNFGKASDKKTQLTNATLGYVKYVREHDWDIENLPTIDPDSRTFIGSLALYLAYVRTQPENDRNDGIKYRPRNEAPPRLALQFTKLAFGLVKVLDPNNKEKWLDTKNNILYLPTIVKKLLTKVAHDTIDGFGQEIIHYLYKNPRSTRERLQRGLKIPATRCHRVLTDLQFMQLIIKTEVVKSVVSRGPNPEGYMVGPRLKDIMTYMYGEV